MYFDYIVLGLIIWGVTDAFFGPDDADDAESGESVPDTTTDPDLVDGGDLLDDAPMAALAMMRSISVTARMWTVAQAQTHCHCRSRPMRLPLTRMSAPSI